MEAEGENEKNDAKNTSNPPELVGTNYNRRRSFAIVTLRDGYPRQSGADADVSSFDETSENESSIGEKSGGESLIYEDSGHYSWTMPGDKGFMIVPYNINLSDSDSDSDMEPESDYDEEVDERRPVILMDPTVQKHDSQRKFRRSLCEFCMEGFDFPRGEIKFIFKQAYVMKGGIIEMIRGKASIRHNQDQAAAVTRNEPSDPIQGT